MDLYVKETGKSNDETIIFLHCGAIASWMWDKQVEAFKDYHCIAPDLPEHGKSAESQSFTINDVAKNIIDIIQNQAKNGKAHLVGIALGAQVIVQILSMAPEVVDRALISGTLIRSAPHTNELLQLLDYTFKVYEPVKNVDFFIKANMRTYNIPKSYFEMFKESTIIMRPESLSRILTENMLFKLPEGLENVETPVLVMTGEKDYKVIKESAQNILNVLPNSKGAAALKLGHLWNLESPEMFNGVLRAWITDNKLPESELTIF